MSTDIIGIVGVGLMGHGIAASIQRSGRAIGFVDHPGNQPTDDLVAAGARVAATPAELARTCGTIILCVTGSPQVEAVLLDETDGALRGLRPGTVVIDLSTAIPASTERLAARVAQAGGRFMDSAMTRTPKEAAEGRLNLLVGADEALFAQVRPLLACFAENITLCGPVGSGHRMKLLHNYVSMGFMALLAEVSAHAHHAGIDMATLIDVLAKGGGGGVALQRISPFLLTGDPSDVPFALSNACKDLTYYTQTATEAGVHREIAEAVTKTLQSAVDGGHGTDYIPQLAAVLRKTDR